MIRDKNMVQAANSMLHNERNRSMEGQEHEEMPTYGNCYRCYWGGPIIIECYHCEPGLFILREEAVGPVQWSFQLIQVEDIFLDSHLIAKLMGKGHDVTKGDIPHSWFGVIQGVIRLPFDILYRKLATK